MFDAWQIMSQQEWQQLNLASHLEPCSDGKKPVKSKLSKRQTVNVDTTSIQLFPFDNPISQPLYTRLVSSHSQKPELERQIQFLVSQYPGCEVVKDIGSGLNFKRKGLLALLERVLSGDVGMVIVANKDRLCRFGFDLIAWMAKRSHCEILVLNNNVLSPEREMLEDVLAIIHVFSCRLYGLRKYKQKIKEDSELPCLSNGKNKGSLDAKNSC